MAKPVQKMYPFRWVLFLYVGTVFLFTLFYLMPCFHEIPISFVDALFLSASGMSVTGLSTIDVSSVLTVWGQLILLIQIQIGGIGIMIFVVYLFLLVGKQLSLPQMIVTSFDQNSSSMKSIKGIMFLILPITFTCEFIGFLFLYPSISVLYNNPLEAVFVTTFHSISSFTNAGFDLFGGSLYEFSKEPLFLMVTGILLVLGTIGFPVILELLNGKGKKSVFTKTNIVMHSVLLMVGFLLLAFFESNNRLSELSIWDKTINAIFLSITSRNGGITSLEVSTLSASSILLLMILMFIGASPNSCGGGIKTTTFAVLLSKILSVIKGREDTILFKRRIPNAEIDKAFLIFFSYSLLFLISTLVISYVEKATLEQIAFEVMSALTTTGLSMGITSELTTFSKVWLIILMLIGRIGIISWIFLFIKTKPSKIKYVTENIVVG